MLARMYENVLLAAPKDQSEHPHKAGHFLLYDPLKIRVCGAELWHERTSENSPSVFLYKATLISFDTAILHLRIIILNSRCYYCH